MLIKAPTPKAWVERIAPHSALLIKLLALFCLLTVLAYQAFPLMTHWEDIIRPTTLRLLAGQSPYVSGEFFNPPWALLPFVPFALLPAKLGSAAVSALTILTYGVVAHRLGAKPLVLLLFLLAPYNVYTYVNVNEDVLVAMGLIMPPQVGLFFVLLKPQVGIGVAVVWLIQAWDRGKWREAMRVSAPVAVAFALSFLVYGLWPLAAREVNWSANTHLWPFGVVFGVAILVKAGQERNANWGLLASPLLSPYVGGSSFALFPLGGLPNQWVMLAMILATWVPTFVEGGPFALSWVLYYLLGSYSP